MDEAEDKGIIKTMRHPSLKDSSSSTELDLGAREMMLTNEMRSFKNRGFHDGYDEGKSSTVQAAFDSGYKKAFERNFILSTLKGVAQALKTSYNLSNNMKFDDASEIETIKNDLVKICRENRLEILAHYVSQIG